MTKKKLGPFSKESNTTLCTYKLEKKKLLAFNAYTFSLIGFLHNPSSYIYCSNFETL